MILVDELKVWTTKRPFHAGSCHLTTDFATDDHLDELHAFAAKIGLKRAWFQDHLIPHYDLTPRRRAAALLAGAVFMPAMQQARERRARGVIYGRRQPNRAEAEE